MTRLLWIIIFLCLATNGRAFGKSLNLMPMYLPQAIEPFNTLVPPVAPSRPEGIKSRDLFTEKVIEDILERHDETFGPTDADNFVLDFTVPASFEFGYRSQVYNGIFIYEREKTRQFGEFVMRKIIEYQIDRRLREQSELRPLYNLKQNATRIEVQSKDGYGLKSRYSISGNFFEIKFINPWKLDTKVTIEMGAPNQGPVSISEMIVAIKKPFDKSVTLELDVKTRDGVVAITRRRKHTPLLETTLTGSTYFHPDGSSEREHLIIAGFNWTI